MTISCNKPGHNHRVNPHRYAPGRGKPIIFDAKDYFGDFHSLDPFMGMKNGYENCWQWPMDFTKGGVYLIKIKPGLILAITDHYSIRPVAIEPTGGDETPFVMSFVLTSPVGGLTSIQGNKRGTPVVFAPPQASITYTPDSCDVVQLLGKARFHCIGIAMKPWVVEEFWSGNQIPGPLNKVLTSPGSSHHYHQQLTITPLINLRLHEILGCRYQGNAKRFFLESKVLEIIILAFEQLQCNECKHQCTFSPIGNVNNSDFILQAKDILLNNMTAPPSLADLARQVGVNKTTLNQCFRKIYGTSIFEYLRICRLEKSRDLLSSGKKTVTEIALEVGYSQQSSFTTEFTKYFGQSPKFFLK